MAYDETLAERVRKRLSTHKRLVEKKMFGGLAFMLRGNMCCGVLNNDLMVRVRHECYESLLKRKGARKMDFTGRPLRGFLFVGPKGHKSAAELRFWINEAVEFVTVQRPPRKKTTRS